MNTNTFFILLFLFGVIYMKNINAQIINNGPKQKITSAMKYQEVREAIERFALFSDCKERKKLSHLFGQKLFHPIHPSLMSTLNNDKISYKQKKQALLDFYAPVTAYIARIYSEPIRELEKRYIPSYTPETRDNPYKTYKCCCKWHTRALAQRGSAIAQYALGVSALELLWQGSVPEYNLDSFKEKITWLKMAARGGVIDAYYFLGYISFQIEAYKDAIEWYKLGASLKHLGCIKSLGRWGVRIGQYSIALDWFHQAAMLEDEEAIDQCIDICETHTKNYKRAVDYCKRAINLRKKKKQAIKYYQEKIKSVELKIED